MSFAGHQRRKSFGQYWINDHSILQKILEAADLHSYDRVIEIGPGRGALTQKLLDSHIDLVHAIEIDKGLISGLRQRFSDYSRFSLLEGDVLSVPLTPLDGLPANKVVANIPYNITGPILQRLLGRLGVTPDNKFELLVLLMQKEVADRILAMPGQSSFSALSVRTQLVAKCRSVCEVPPCCFTPSPKVDSKVIIIEPFKIQDRLPLDIESNVEKIISAAFLERRKKLRNTLIKFANLKTLEQLANDIGITLDQRPQEISPMNWIDLAKGVFMPNLNIDEKVLRL